MDKWSWFFGLFGVVAFLLAIPLSILANVLTPKVQDWWATTSNKRRIRRIQVLEEQVKAFTSLMNDNALRFDVLVLALRQFMIGAVPLVYLLINTSYNVITLHAHLSGVTHQLVGEEQNARDYWRERYGEFFLASVCVFFFLQATLTIAGASRLAVGKKVLKLTATLKRLVDNSTPPRTDKASSAI